MQVLSANIAQPTTIQWRGQEVLTGIYKYAVETPIFLNTEDVDNDHVLIVDTTEASIKPVICIQPIIIHSGKINIRI